MFKVKKIHIVRKPFMARKGQFCENETEAIGILCHAIETAGDEYIFKIKGDEETIYSCRVKEAMEFGRKHNSFWKNKKGKYLIILPLFFFKAEKPKEIQQKLL